MKRGIRRLAAVAATAFACLGLAAAAQAGGPIVLAGIDAEDGGLGGHGPISNYQTLAGSVLSNVTNGGSGILGIGCGKNAFDNVTTFWNAVASGNGTTLTCVNGAAAIASTSFAGYAMIGVASDQFNTFSGGLTNAENDALATRSADIASFVNNGGGLLGFSSVGLSNPYPYLGGIGSFSFGSVFTSDITPTAEGLAVGITDALDVCCWHDSYLAFPSFMDVLATYAGGAAAAIGGSDVTISTMSLTPVSAPALEVGSTHCVTAQVVDENGNPQTGITVYFTVTGANPGSGSAVTDASGSAVFCYTGAAAGDDDINAYADMDGDGVQDSTEPFGFAEAEWVITNVPPDCNASAGGPSMWPPNHKLRSFTVGGATDPDGDPVTITITGVTQDEPLDGAADGNTSPDAVITGADTVDLRAERSGVGDGRVYVISYTASDGQGGSCSGSVAVAVPHDQGNGDTAVDSGQAYDSLTP